MAEQALNGITDDGSLGIIDKIRIQIPKDGKDLYIQTLPEITESKGALLSDQNVLGRSSPIKIYSGSGPRVFTMVLHYYIYDDEDPDRIVESLRMIASATHPKYDGTYEPIPVCSMLVPGIIQQDQSTNPADVICKSYNITYDTQCWWYYTPSLVLPFHTSVSIEWERVYSFEALPGQSKVIQGAY